MSKWIKEAIRCHEDWCAHGDCCNKHEETCPVPKALEELVDLERQLKEANNVVTKLGEQCDYYIKQREKLQQQLQEANERIKELEIHVALNTRPTDTPATIMAYKTLEAENAQLRQERDALLNHEWPRTLHGLEADNDTLRADCETYEKALEQIYVELDGLPITGEKVTPKSRKYLDAPEQIRNLRAEVERLKGYESFAYEKINELEAKVQGAHDMRDVFLSKIDSLTARVQELEKALNAVIDYAPFGKEDYNIAKRALDGGKE